MAVVPVGLGRLGRQQWDQSWGQLLEVSAGSAVVGVRKLSRHHFEEQRVEEQLQLRLAALNCWEQLKMSVALEVAQAWVAGRLDGGTNFVYVDSLRGVVGWEGWRGARSMSRYSFDCPCCVGRI
jgi:hypothetical protein